MNAGRLLGGAALVLALLGLGRCVMDMSPSAAEASTHVVRSLQHEPLSARGLGDLVIGRTTLAEVIDGYTIGKPSLLMGDDFAVELEFADGQLFLMFCATFGDAAHRRAFEEGPRTLTLSLHSGPRTLREHAPEVADMRLTSIAVCGTWFEGTTDTGISLGDPVVRVLDRHRPGGGRTRDPFLAGTATPEPMYTGVPTPGLIFHPDVDAGFRRGESSGSLRTRAEATGARVAMIVAHRQ